MAITNTADVKILAALYTILGEGEPTTSTTGQLGDIYVDVDEESATYGNSYILDSISGSVYTWNQDITEDVRINKMIQRAERDYLRIRGRDFDIDADTSEIIYPDGADLVGAEMVCYLLGVYEGRGKDSEGVAGRSASYERKIAGYPASIAAQIERFVEVG